MAKNGLHWTFGSSRGGIHRLDEPSHEPRRQKKNKNRKEKTKALMNGDREWLGMIREKRGNLPSLRAPFLVVTVAS